MIRSGLPWWFSGWGSTCQFREHRFSTPDLGGGLRVAGPGAPAADACTLELRSAAGGATAARRLPHAAQLEKAHTRQGRPSQE